MVSLRLREIIEEEGEKLPETCTKARRQRVPPRLKTATDTEDSTTIELYVQERTLQNTRSSTLKRTILYLGQTSQEIPGLKKAQRIYSERLDGVDIETARIKLLPTLRKLTYEEENHLGRNAWEYIYSYMDRKDVKDKLEIQVENIRGGLESKK